VLHHNIDRHTLRLLSPHQIQKKPTLSWSLRAGRFSLTTLSWISSTFSRATSSTALNNSRPTPRFLELGRTYIPNTRPLWAFGGPCWIEKPAVPTSSPSRNAPTMCASSSRPANHATSNLSSSSKVLRNNSGFAFSASRRIARKDAASSDLKRRIVASALMAELSYEISSLRS
jgi:hypothetical protein